MPDLYVPNIAQSFGGGFQFGQGIQDQIKQRQTQSALAKYAPAIVGGDPNARTQAVQEIAKIDPETAMKLQSQFAAMDDAQIKHAQNQTAILAGVGNWLKGLPPEQRKAALAAQAPRLVASGIPQQAIDTFDPSDQNIEGIIAQSTSIADQLKQEQQNREFNFKQSTDQRDFQYKQQRDKIGDQFKRQDLSIQQQKLAQGDASSLTPEAADMLGSIALTNGGTVPSFGMGGGKQKAAIFNNMAGKAKAQGISGEDIATGAASFKANSQALAQVTKMQTAIGSYEQTASQNADIALGLMQKGAGPTGSPVVDRWIRAGGKSIGGDADVSKFDTALNTFKNEYAKVMSGGYGAAGTSDSMRHEADQLISPNMSREQILGNIQVMKQDMANRTKALNDYRSNLVQHIHSGASSIYQPVTGAQPQQQPQANGGNVIRYDANGNRIQ